jgi:hypothetical protein
MVWPQNPISKHLHHHAISSMLFDKIFETHCARILSCFGPRMGTCFTIQLIFPTFWLFSPFFPWCFKRNLDYFIAQLEVSFNACAHISLTLWYPPLMLCSWQWMHENPWCSSQHLCYHYAKCWLPCGIRTITCVSFNHVQSLLSTIQHCGHQRWHLHFSQHCHYQPNVSRSIFQTLHKDLSSPMWFKPKK